MDSHNNRNLTNYRLPLMKVTKYPCLAFCVFICAIFFSSFSGSTSQLKSKFKFPYRSAGLTDREAAVHLLNRFTYGATPGQIDEVVNSGLENWFAHQLAADLPEDSLDNRLKSYDALHFTNNEVAIKYPERGAMYRNAAKDGYVNKDSLYLAKDKAAFNRQIQAYMKLKGYRPEGELGEQFMSQKILRAAYSDNQLQEVMTDFWFNHFNVSYAKNGPGKYIPAYERDVIRPGAFGKFDELLLATAKSPAMLYFLDNAKSVGAQPQKKVATQPLAGDQMMMSGLDTVRRVVNFIPRRSVPGLNENYARELMELHTLGVDGGYKQSDVTQAARILTGWTVYPLGENAADNSIVKQYTKKGIESMMAQGYVHEGDFLFDPTHHDKGEKTVLGHSFGNNGGYEEGVDLLKMLAHNSSTAKFITRKIAVHFVSDNPPQSLLDKMSKSFLDNDGDIKQVLIIMVTAPEFWSKSALREKTKSPFELAISSVRALNADVTSPMPLFNWVSRMGEHLYYYLAPTGFPDRGTYWINTGALLNRMNFGLALTTGRIPGVIINTVALNHDKEPESPMAALMIYSKLLLPERNLDQTIRRLTPMLTQPDLAATIDRSAASAPVKISDGMAANDPMMSDSKMQLNMQPKETHVYARVQRQTGNNNMLSQVVGIIIGSPEFQRR